MQSDGSLQLESVEYLKRKNVPGLVDAVLSKLLADEPEEVYEYVHQNPVLKPVTTKWPSGLAPVSDEEFESLKTFDFDVFPIYESVEDRPRLLLMVKAMMEALGSQSSFGIKEAVLCGFLLRVYEGYNEAVVFHNFRHAFNVAQTYYAFLNQFKICERGVLTALEQFAGLVAALCHDLGHPGLNNAFHVQTVSPLAIRYNNISVLENFHSARAFELMQAEGFFSAHASKVPGDWMRFRDLVISCILATDVSQHKKLFGLMPGDGEPVDYAANENQRKTLLIYLVECADISNEVRSHDFSEKWAPLVMEEFYRQGEQEREIGVLPKPMFTRGATTLASEQCGFITYVCEGAYKNLVKLCPESKVVLNNLLKNKELWEKKK
eukprot:PhM_4_TR16707/c0_g3_i1/m.87106/K13761/PDE9; high affinity cGMP-specific 3',5'-cyclic phosphodiesterase 9